MLAQSSVPSELENSQFSIVPPKGMLLIADLNGTLHGYSIDSINQSDCRLSISQMWSTRLSDIMFSSHNVSSKPLLFDFETNTPIYLIPSLQGGLFLVHNNSVESLPFMTDTLFTKSFQLPDDLIVVGNKNIEALRIDLLTGQVLFSSASECASNSTPTSHPSALFRVTSRIVRAVSARNGEERWKFHIRDVLAEDSISAEQFHRLRRYYPDDPFVNFHKELGEMIILSVPTGDIYNILKRPSSNFPQFCRTFFILDKGR
ncbi:hypothetical protein ACOME3_010086 [Neoechinorhynchus agilis]